MSSPAAPVTLSNLGGPRFARTRRREGDSKRRIREVAAPRGIATALVVAISLIGENAHADGAKLTYTRGRGAEACPDEGALREAVAQKVGRDPFDGEDVHVEVHVERRADDLAADVEVREGSVARGRRTLFSKSSSCDELASALAVTISVALDPARFGEPPRRWAPPPTPSPADRPFAEEPPPPAPSSTQDHAPKGVTWQAAGGGGVAFGAAPAPAAAFLLSFGARWRRVSLDLEGRTHLPSSAAVAEGGPGDGPGAGVSASSSLVALVPCFHVGPAGLCAVGAAGVVRGEGKGVALPSTDSSFGAAAGARLTLELALLPELGLRAGIDGMATIHGTRLTLAGREVWASPSLWASSWIAAVVSFR